jgi:hypothetical protein
VVKQNPGAGHEKLIVAAVTAIREGRKSSKPPGGGDDAAAVHGSVRKSVSTEGGKQDPLRKWVRDLWPDPITGQSGSSRVLAASGLPRNKFYNFMKGTALKLGEYKKLQAARRKIEDEDRPEERWRLIKEQSRKADADRRNELAEWRELRDMFDEFDQVGCVVWPAPEKEPE